MINLDEPQLTMVKAILRAYVPDRRVAAFGSRVQGTAKEFSDLDLVLLSDEPVAADVLSEPHPKDLKRITDAVAIARPNARVVIVSIHAHEIYRDLTTPDP